VVVPGAWPFAVAVAVAAEFPSPPPQADNAITHSPAIAAAARIGTAFRTGRMSAEA
jgi:hypothetical protein